MSCFPWWSCHVIHAMVIIVLYTTDASFIFHSIHFVSLLHSNYMLTCRPVVISSYMDSILYLLIFLVFCHLRHVFILLLFTLTRDNVVQILEWLFHLACSMISKTKFDSRQRVSLPAPCLSYPGTCLLNTYLMK